MSSDDKTEFLNFGNVRTPEQRALMERIAADGVCPFCNEHVRNYHPKPILKESSFWLLTENINPYIGAKRHFIFIYKPAHITSPLELTPEASADLFALAKETISEYKIEGGTIAMRFGTKKKYANSVTHLHAHLVEPDVDDPNHTGIKFSVSKAAPPQK